MPIDLTDIGLIASDNKNNRYYDLFKNRIMFPIEDYHGNIIGFSGRIYNSTSNAKYMNSHENVLFHKSNVLYNYYHAINDIKLNDLVIVFEGFMDVIAAYRCGINNSICTMGTSITSDQVRIITSLTKNIVLCYDGDNPGIEASKRAIKLFLQAGSNIRVCVLPEGIDPDDYINKFGSNALNELLLKKNVPAIDYLYEISKRNLDINNPNSINRFVKEIKSLFNDFKSKILENYIINKASRDLNVTVETLESELKGIVINNKEENQNNNYYDNSYYDNSYYDYNDIPPIDYVPSEFEDVSNFDIPSNYTENNDYIDTKPKKNKSKIISKKYYDAECNLIYCAYLSKDYSLKIKNELKFEDSVDRTCRDILFKMHNYYNNHDEIELNEFYKELNALEKEKLVSIIDGYDKIYNNSDPETRSTDLQLLESSISECIKVVKQSKYQKSAIDTDSSIDGAMKMADSKKKVLRKVNK